MRNVAHGGTLHLSPAALRRLAGDLEARGRSLARAMSGTGAPPGLPGSRTTAAITVLDDAWRSALSRRSGLLDGMAAAARSCADAADDADQDLAESLRRAASGRAGARP